MHKDQNIVKSRSWFGVFFVVACTAVVGASALADPVPPSYKADPSVYKVVYEDASVRLIVATYKKGVHAKPHSHLVPFYVVTATDCDMRVHAADGTTSDVHKKPLDGTLVGLVASHSAENIGSDTCVEVYIEPKTNPMKK